MIPKIICFIFGHIFKQEVVSNNQIIPGEILFKWVKLPYCLRCGKKLED